MTNARVPKNHILGEWRKAELFPYCELQYAFPPLIAAVINVKQNQSVKLFT